MKKAVICFGIVFCIFVFSFGAFAEEIRLTSCDWQPYAGKELSNFGFTSEILKSAFERVGYKVQFKIYPWNRAIEQTKKGKMDGIYSAYYSEERAKTFALSDPYIDSKVHFCKLKKNKKIVYSGNLRDLSSYTVGVVRGYVNSPEFDKADYIKKDEASSDLTNLRKLLKGRIDLIIIDKFVALYHLKNSPFIEGNSEDVVFLNPPLKTLPVHLMFSRAVMEGTRCKD